DRTSRVRGRTRACSGCQRAVNRQRTDHHVERLVLERQLTHVRGVKLDPNAVSVRHLSRTEGKSFSACLRCRRFDKLLIVRLIYASTKTIPSAMFMNSKI